MVTTLGWVLAGVLPSEFALVATGLVIGTLQWVVLRQYLRQPGWWIVFSALGWTAGWGVIITLIPPQLGILTEPVVGAALGTTQWLFLRRHLYQAGWWIPVSTLGWTVGLTGLTGELLVGAVVGAVTGIALELLLRYPSLMKVQ
jgi:serine/threonine-protein kinase